MQDNPNEDAGVEREDDEARLALAQKRLLGDGAAVVAQLEFALRRMPVGERLDLISDLKSSWDIGTYATGPALLKMMDRIEVGTYKAMPYPDYLHTDHWRETRETALQRAEHQCQVCSSTRMLQVHHRSYVNVGEERPADLTVLCDVCHARHHGQRAA